jgi:hypothetical protein
MAAYIEAKAIGIVLTSRNGVPNCGALGAA